MKFIKLSVLLFLLLFLTGCKNSNNISLNSENTNTPSPVKTSTNTTSPAQNTEMAIPQNTEELIKEFTTTIHTKTQSRQHNLELTSSKINGHIVKSGETFSFCTLVGRSTPEAGYLKAEIFDSKGNKKQGYGGGNCQVSSTLFNAVDGATGLEVLERHNHSNKVPYIETGKDAAIYYGSYDFKFRNNNDFDIKIISEPTKDNLAIKIMKIL